MSLKEIDWFIEVYNKRKLVPTLAALAAMAKVMPVSLLNYLAPPA